MKAGKSIAVAALTFAGVATIGTGVLFAATDKGSNGRFSGVVNAIAGKFNLNAKDVQQVFDDQMNAERETRHKALLDQAVKDGKLTQAQADQILAKLKEVDTSMASLEGKTAEERQTALKDLRTKLEEWAKANNIPTQYLPFFGAMGKGMGGRGMHGNSPIFNLDQAVKDGKLTQAQADQITAKHEELRSFMTTLQGKAAEERQAAMKTKTDELKQWAKANNIPEQYLSFGQGMGRGQGSMGKGMGMGEGKGAGQHRMMIK